MEKAIAACYIFGTAYGLLVFHLIKSYHKCKPLGMQTILSRIFVFGINVTSVCGGSMAVLMALNAILSPLSNGLGMAVSLILFVCYYHCYMALFAVQLTKYLSIYHGLFLENIPEEITITFIKVTIKSVPWVVAFFEFGILTPLRDTVLYCLMTAKDQNNCGLKTIGYFLPSLIFLNFGFGTFFVARIEKDQLNSLEEGNQTFLAKLRSFLAVNKTGITVEATGGYRLSVPRLLVFLAMILTCMLTVQLISGMLSFQVNNLVFFMVGTVIGTTTILVTHKSLLDHAKMKVHQWSRSIIPIQLEDLFAVIV